MYKFYEIRCNITDEVYFGKTTKILKERLSEHKKPTNSCTSKQIIERGDYIMIQINVCQSEVEEL